jgi:hypothetical protein
MTDIDTIAARMAQIYYRQAEDRKVLWEHLAPSDRSMWRLVARGALDVQAETGMGASVHASARH